MFSRIDHAAWLVRDAAACVDFYRENFGFTVEREVEGRGPIGRIVFLRLGDTRLEILESGTAPPIAGSHLSVTTTDFEADYRRLQEKGIKVLQEPLPASGGRRRAVLQGPAGEEIEISG